MEAIEAKELFERTYGAARLNLKCVSREDALRVPGEQGNTINWMIGHILAYRSRLLESLGAEPLWDSPEVRRYAGEDGGRWTDDRALPLERLRADLATSQERLSARLFPPLEGSVANDLPFFHFHEAYHVGQIGLVRRCLGLPGVIEPDHARQGNNQPWR